MNASNQELPCKAEQIETVDNVRKDFDDKVHRLHNMTERALLSEFLYPGFVQAENN